MQVRIIIPQNVNYFYEQAGRRLAEAFRSFGAQPSVATIDKLAAIPSDLTIYTSISEIEHSLGSAQAMTYFTSEVRRTSQVVATLCMDCVETPWYARLKGLSKIYGVNSILDMGICEQNAKHEDDDPEYVFLFNGLTPSEAKTLQTIRHQREARRIPWAFIGHSTEQRIALVDYLVDAIHPSGFAFLPPLEPIKADGKYHLNEEQYARVLSKSQYQLWCSHHTFFYMEPERFRASVLTGCLPIKVVAPYVVVNDESPFNWLVTTQDQLKEVMNPRLLEKSWDRFASEFLSLPGLASEFQRYCLKMGLRVQKKTVTPETRSNRFAA